MKISELIAAFRERDALRDAYITERLTKVRQDLGDLSVALDQMRRVVDERTTVRAAVEAAATEVRQRMRTYDIGELDDDEEAAFEAALAAQSPGSHAILREFRAILGALESRRRLQPVLARADETEEQQGHLLSRAASSQVGIREFVPSGPEPAPIAVMDFDDYDDRDMLVIRRHDAALGIDVAERDEVILARPKTPSHAAVVSQHFSLRVASIMTQTDRSTWFENGITNSLCMLLRVGKLGARTFRYSLNGQKVVARLSAFQQRGKYEKQFGDVGLVVERIDLPEKHERRIGIGALEAKLRSYDDGKVHTIRPTQSREILKHFPLARLLVYDRAPLTPDGHAICLPLRDFAALKSRTTVQALPAGWQTLSSQLFERYFLGEDLDFREDAVKKGTERRGFFMEYWNSLVAVGDDFDELERLIELHEERARALTHELERQRGLERGGRELSR